MKTERRNKCCVRQLATASCFSLVIGWQAYAESQVQQPHSAVAPIALAGNAVNAICSRDRQVSEPRSKAGPARDAQKSGDICYDRDCRIILRR
jgi:hypothetical protein